MVKGTFAGTDWKQDKYEAYLNNSKQKLKMMELKPVSIKTGEYRTWFEPAAVSDIIDIINYFRLYL